MLLKLLLMLSLSASATEEPKFTILEYKAPAPFAGILFDEQAMAKRLENLRIEHKSLTDEYDLFIIQKDMEIKALSNSLKKTSPRHKWLYFAGGVIIGTASSYNVYRIVNGR